MIERVRRGRADRGQTTMLLVVFSMIVLVMLGFTALLPLAEGNDRLSSAQAGAEAAALAGAKDVTDNVLLDVLQHVRDEGDLNAGFFCSRGEPAARELAGANGTSLIDYCYDWRHDRVDTTVRVVDPASNGGRPTAKASAQVNFPLSACRFEDRPTPGQGGPPPVPPAPPADQPLLLDCGSFSLGFIIDGGTGRLHLSDGSALLDLDQPRLVR